MALLGFLLMCSVTGCATGQGNYCLIAKPIYLDKADVLTDQTAAAILTHDQTWAALCR
jgi:hypothetical protein